MDDAQKRAEELVNGHNITQLVGSKHECPGKAVELIAAAIREAVAAERERCDLLVKHYLQFDSQRAVSWHEVQDCREAIREGK